MRAMVVALDVGADRRPRLVEGLKLLAPDAALLELREPRLDERLRLGIAVAAAAVGDPELAQAGTEAAARKRGAVVGAEDELVGRDRVRADPTLDDGERLFLATPEVERPGGDLARAAVDRRV